MPTRKEAEERYYNHFNSTTSEADRKQRAHAQALKSCTNGCVINSLVGGDHAYCTCHCHIGTSPATPPSRERSKA